MMNNTNCYYCNYCYSCDSCYSCNSCNSCDFCNSCNFCNYCINLKMTEYNYFCYADDKTKDWFQRPRYQVFNTQLTKEEYSDISKVNIKLELDKNESYATRYKTAFSNAWQELSQEDKKSIINLPWFNKEDFKKYYWVDIQETEELTLEQICKELGRNIKIIK